MTLSVNNIILRAAGFKKVALPDVKGVLKPEQSYKWIKNTANSKTTILPSGTKVIKKNQRLEDTLTIKKYNGDVIKRSYSVYNNIITQNGKTIYNGQNSPELQKLITKDGKDLLMTFKADKLVEWTRYGNGEQVSTEIKRPFGIVYSSVKTYDGGQKIVAKSVMKVPGQKQALIEQSVNDGKQIVHTIHSIDNGKKIENLKEIIEL